MAERILVLDVGTSVAKAHVFGLDGRVHAQAGAAFATRAPEPGAAVHDVDDWWRALRGLVPPLVERCGMPDAIGITGQMHGVVPVTRDGAALGPYLTLHDRRGTQHIARMEAIVEPEAIYRITGGRLSAAAPAAHLHWLRAAQPDVYATADAFLAAKDYLRLRLTGNLATEPLDAAGSLLYDLAAQRWSATLLEAWDIPAAKLPPILEPTAIAGTLQRGPAHELGLTHGMPVVVGAGDDIEVLGAGALRPGQGVEHLGTTGSILVCHDQLRYDPLRRLEIGPHVIPGLWLVGGSTSAAGRALRWLADLLGVDDLPEPRPSTVPPHRRALLIPHLAGQRAPLWQADVQGALVGLDVSLGREDVVRAVFDGVTLSLRDILEALRAIDAAPRTLVVTDRASAAWAGPRADAYQVALQIPHHHDSTALGTMILTAVGIHAFDGIEQAVAALVRFSDERCPDPARRQEYHTLYQRYCRGSRAAVALEEACA